LLTTIETMYPGMRLIHVFLDNASALTRIDPGLLI